MEKNFRFCYCFSWLFHGRLSGIFCKGNGRKCVLCWLLNCFVFWELPLKNLYKWEGIEEVLRSLEVLREQRSFHRKCFSLLELQNFQIVNFIMCDKILWTIASQADINNLCGHDLPWYVCRSSLNIPNPTLIRFLTGTFW